MITFPQISYMWSSRCLWRCGRRIVWAGVGVARCAIISAPTRQTWQTTSRRIILINVTSVRSAAKSLGRVTLLKSTSKDCTMTSPSAAWFARKCFPRGRHWKLTWKVILCSRSSRRVTQSCNKFWCHSHLTMLNKILCAFNRCHLKSSWWSVCQNEHTNVVVGRINNCKFRFLFTSKCSSFGKLAKQNKDKKRNW